MARFTLRQLACFVAVAETGSLSGAAERLHVSHTAVAAALSELERLLRSQLAVRRKAHGVTLTPAGTFLYKRAAALLMEADEIETDIGSLGTELAGPLVVGCYVSMAPTIVPPLWMAFGQRHPKVGLSFITSGTQDEIPVRLLDGELDLAIVYDMDLPRGIRSVELHSAPAHVILSPEHPLAASAELSLADLAEEPMIMLETPPSIQHTMGLFEHAGLDPLISHRTADFELTRSLVARGVGYAVMVQRISANVSYEGLPLVSRPIAPPAMPVRVLMIWSEAARLSNRARAMIELAVEADLKP